MLTRPQFLSSLSTFASLPAAAAALAAAILVTLLLAAAPARADSNLLHGPFPFLKDNEVSAHYLLAAGAGDSWSGDKVGLDYGYRLGGPIWLNLELNLQTGHCRFAGSCANSGDVYETLVGGKWMFRTALPIVPYAKAAAGLLYLFPDEATSAVRPGGARGRRGQLFLLRLAGLRRRGQRVAGRRLLRRDLHRQPRLLHLRLRRGRHGAVLRRALGLRIAPRDAWCAR
jgi:hypothetical protein